MPFGLSNAGATFQRAMDYAFRGLIGKLIEIYQDDLTVFSKDGKTHICHLRQVLDRCREFGISLNPAKSVFGVIEGKLLGHIITKEGVKIEPKRVEAIRKVPLPMTKKLLQSFLGQTNFVHRFIPNYAKIMKPIYKLLKKDAKFEWNDNAVYFVSGKVSARVRNVTSRRHRRKMSENVARPQKNTKTLIFFNFLNL
jgi:hypothetical protein